MDSHVSLQVSILWKAFATQFTFVWFLSCVCPHVHHKGWLIAHIFATYAACTILTKAWKDTWRGITIAELGQSGITFTIMVKYFNLFARLA